MKRSEVVNQIALKIEEFFESNTGDFIACGDPAEKILQTIEELGMFPIGRPKFETVTINNDRNEPTPTVITVYEWDEEE
jgi:hypothetical protein